MKVQAQKWQHATTNSTWNLGVQPDSGFMYFMNKESTAVMLLSYYTN